MTEDTFQKLLLDLAGFSPLPELSFGGYGEPLLHPQIISMIGSAHQAGVKTSLVTNGTLLTEDLSRNLIQSGLTGIWISLDSTHQASFQAKHGGSYQEGLRHRLETLQVLKDEHTHNVGNTSRLEIGLAAVLNRNNLQEVIDLIQTGQRLGLDAFFISHLEPYTNELSKETFYQTSLRKDRVDQEAITRKIKTVGDGIRIEGSLNGTSGKCPFAEKGELALRWDGEISPCLPLLYEHDSYLGSWKRRVFAYSLGNLESISLSQIWQGGKYSDLKTRLLEEDFSPCFSCRDCWLSEDNLQDCMGFEHPTCGGCPWAQGLIACP
jgi:MoaA/NifB/PqqE/SkfB family radical SAM enzyme